MSELQIIEWDKPFTCYQCNQRKKNQIQTFGHLDCLYHPGKWSKKHQYYKCCETNNMGCRKMDHMPTPQNYYFLSSKESDTLKEFHSWNPKNINPNALIDIKNFEKDSTLEKFYMCFHRNTNRPKNQIVKLFNDFVKNVISYKQQTNGSQITKSNKMKKNSIKKPKVIKKKNPNERSWKRKRKSRSPSSPSPLTQGNSVHNRSPLLL